MTKHEVAAPAQEVPASDLFFDALMHPEKAESLGLHPMAVTLLRNLAEARRKLNIIEVLRLGAIGAKLQQGLVDEEMVQTVEYLNTELGHILAHLDTPPR